MSRSVDLFVSWRESIEALAVVITDRSGLELHPRPDGRGFDLAEGNLSAVLHRHGFADDDGLPLSHYPYAVSMRTQAGGHLGSSLEVSMMRRLAACLDGIPVLLVLDLQYRAEVQGRAGSAVGGSDE